MNTSFLDEILELYLNIRILDCSVDCVLARDEQTKKAYYIYRPNKDGFFCFHLLSEINKNYLPWFEKAIERSKCSVTTKETKNDYYECLTL